MISFDGISQALKIAELAVLHHRAKQAAHAAKRDYHLAWKRFETDDPLYGGDGRDYWIHPEERIGQGHPSFDEACAATKNEHETYKAKKREEYNIKRRLENAIRGIDRSDGS